MGAEYLSAKYQLPDDNRELVFGAQVFGAHLAHNFLGTKIHTSLKGRERAAQQYNRSSDLYHVQGNFCSIQAMKR